ncbi:MAG: hypothetical protein CUN55_14885, partial [Phototrophicales bacterium]
MSALIFISYRISDTLDITGRIYDHLRSYFPAEMLFRDMDTLEIGDQLSPTIQRHLNSCRVMLVIIGRDWVSVENEQGRRLLQEKDFVRREVQHGLSSDTITVIPILVDNTPMPTKDELPDVLQKLVEPKAHSVSSKEDFYYHMRQLAEKIAQLIDFPLPDIDAPPRRIGTLPINFTVTQFFDRIKERDQLYKLIHKGRQVICVYGFTGSGKSAVASYVLEQLISSVPENTIEIDGLLCFPNANAPTIRLDTIISQAQKMFPTHNLRLDGQMSAEQRADLLLSATRTGKYILLLDNFEDYQDDEHFCTDAELEILFQRVLDKGGLTIVVTSQLPLKLRYRSAKLVTIDLDKGLPSTDAREFILNLPAVEELKINQLVATDPALDVLIEKTSGNPRALEAAVSYLRDTPLETLSDLLAYNEIFSGNITEHIVGAAIAALPDDLRRVLEGVAALHNHATDDALLYVLQPFLALDNRSLREKLGRLFLRKFVRVRTQLDGTHLYGLHSTDAYHALKNLPKGTETNENTYTLQTLWQRGVDYFRHQRTDPNTWHKIDDLNAPLHEFFFLMLLKNYTDAFNLTNLLSPYLQ